MLRFIVREVFTGHVVFAGGEPETHYRTFDGDVVGLEAFLRQEDLPTPDLHLTRELIGVEMLEGKPNDQ